MQGIVWTWTLSIYNGWVGLGLSRKGGEKKKNNLLKNVVYLVWRTTRLFFSRSSTFYVMFGELAWCKQRPLNYLMAHPSIVSPNVVRQWPFNLIEQLVYIIAVGFSNELQLSEQQLQLFDHDNNMPLQRWASVTLLWKPTWRKRASASGGICGMTC
jgi:hypothetical protein